MKFLLKLIILIIVLIIIAAAWIWSGSYNIAADSPHWAVTHYVIEQVRERSIESRAGKIKVPNLDDPTMIREGAEHYAAMCAGCHLAPGKTDSELRTALYPRPPDLTQSSPDPAEAFWVIKHGIKMTGMPAWGKSHNEQEIWGMVAYLQKQPDMSAARYRELTTDAEAHEHGHGHEHGHDR